MVRRAQAAKTKAQEVVEEELDVEELTEQVIQDQDDEDEDFTEVLTDARLRLELGRLYEMVMNHSLFDGVEVDARASKIVQKQIRKFAKEQIELTLGMRQEQASANTAIVSSPFNSLEVEILKKLASAASKGATESVEEEPVTAPAAPPKKKTLNTISSNSQKTTPKAQPAKPKPIAKKVEPIQRTAKPQLPPEFEPDYEPLSKPVHEMNTEELMERDRQAAERQKSRQAAMPKDRAPMPDAATMEMLAQSQVQRALAPGKGNLSGLIFANLKGKGKI